MSEQTMQDKQKKCAEEIEAILKKYGFNLQIQPPVPVLVPMQVEEKKAIKP